MNPLHPIKDLARRLSNLTARVVANDHKLEQLKALTARSLIRQIKQHGPYDSIHDAEFSVSSQFGDDGIIQYLLHHTGAESPTFVEFGVESYTESNTRFLLTNNNWRGLVMDGNESYVEYIRRDSIYWRHDLTAVQAFINRDNINQLIAAHGFAGALGLLSIDIDGNDYWVWKAVEVVTPAIVVIEYNSVFGNRHAITVPYTPDFDRTKAHASNLFWGASLKALLMLAAEKGYVFVGCNSNGNNAYFVRSDRAGRIKGQSLESGYVESRFRESRDEEGRLTFLAGSERLRAIAEMTVYDLEREALVKIKDLDVSGGYGN